MYTSLCRMCGDRGPGATGARARVGAPAIMSSAAVHVEAPVIEISSDEDVDVKVLAIDLTAWMSARLASLGD